MEKAIQLMRSYVIRIAQLEEFNTQTCNFMYFEFTELVWHCCEIQIQHWGFKSMEKVIHATFFHSAPADEKPYLHTYKTRQKISYSY